MSVGKAKRASTTAKVTRSMFNELAFLLAYSDFSADGFIARFRGVEYAITGVVGERFLPCPVLHPGVRPFYFDEMTIRKGLV